MKFDKENFSKVLVKIKNNYGSINQMAEKTNVTTAYLSKLIRLMYNNAPSPEILKKIAKNSNGITTYNELMYICGYFSSDTIIEDFYEKNFNEIEKKHDSNTQLYMCPVYRQISAKQLNWEENCIEGRIPVAPILMNIVNPEEHFFLHVNDESMNKIVKNGAYALIHKQDTIENGDIAVVLVNGYDATLKKFTKHGDIIVLEPMSNDNIFQTQIYDETTNIKVLGKYIGKFEINNK